MLAPTLRAFALVATWIALRALGGLDSVSVLAATAALGLLAPWVAFGGSARQDARLTWPSAKLLVVAVGLGLALAAAGVGAAWALGHDTGANWALRHGLQLGWWTDRLPFMPGKLLALLVIALITLLVVIPEELVLRGVALRAGERLVGPGRALQLETGLTMLAATGDLWLRPVPAAAWAIHLAVAGAVAFSGGLLARRCGSVVPGILLHTAVRAVLVLHAFAFIPRLYR